MACYDLGLEVLSMTSLERHEPQRISINSKRHYVTTGFPNVPDGIVLPSVTTVLSSMAPVGKIMALVNWRKRVGDEEANRRTRLAANRGTWLHAILEDWFGDEDIENHLEKAPDWQPYFQAVEPFLQGIEQPVLVESAVAWYDQEQAIGYSGTLDMVATMSNGSLALVDWKTSYKEKPEKHLADYKRQLGAYSMAAEQMYGTSIDEAWCVIACFDPEDKDSEPSLQLVHLDGFELVAQQRIMQDTVQRYFAEHYPGGRAFTMTADKG
jgi:genome maintenance exonuclease 1